MSSASNQRALLCLSAAGFHRIAYRDWGPAGATRLVVAVHGLTRNSRDFDELAAALAAADLRVICPDIVGRGDSDPLSDPKGYGYPQYLADMAALIARLDVESVDWIGTSMGGLIGMMLAALPNSPIRRLVINDVGPFISKAALVDILAYVGQDPLFPDIESAEAYFRETYAPFGALTDQQWRDMTRHSTRVADDGLRLKYDPRIAEPFREIALEDLNLWSLWEKISCPTLTLRGVESKLLTRETAEEMSRRGPKAELLEIPGCGHAPSLKSASQITALRDWLLRN